MATEIYLVKVGMSMTEGVVEEWYIADGDKVQIGEMLYRLETEKVNLDVDAEANGTVKHVVAEGVTMEPGDVVGFIFAEGEDIPEDLGVSASSAQAVEEDHAQTLQTTEETPPPSPRTGGGPSSPIARRLARELGIDLASVTGTGPGGRITKDDVEKAAASVEGAPPETPSPATTIPVRGMRKTIAQRMQDSLLSMAQLTMDMDVNMDEAIKLRNQLVEEWSDQGVKPTYTDLVIRAAAKALTKHPRMNASWGDKDITLHGDIHIGVAVALDEGLIVPVIKHAQRITIKELAIESARLASAARSSSLALDDMQGGTFTVSALGMFGVDSFTPIINAPQAGILGINRIRDDVTWDADRAVKTQVMRLSLTWDHRVLDGGPAALFLSEVRALLEAPYRLLL
jgi:pyruvate dehydrogenase E2 component (dihydrolipoamide acetyltransferase)